MKLKNTLTIFGILTLSLGVKAQNNLNMAGHYEIQIEGKYHNELQVLVLTSKDGKPINIHTFGEITGTILAHDGNEYTIQGNGGCSGPWGGTHCGFKFSTVDNGNGQSFEYDLKNALHAQAPETMLGVIYKNGSKTGTAISATKIRN